MSTVTDIEIHERAAKAVHEANAVYCESYGDPKPAWDDLEDGHWMKQSAHEMVQGLVSGTPASAAEQHEIWMASRKASGWVYGLVKKPYAKPPTHPSLVPFAELPVAERLKDDLAVRVACAVLGIPAPF